MPLNILGSSLAPLVVGGAVSAKRIRFPIPLSIRACGFPAHGLPMIFWTWLCSLRVTDGAAKSVQAVPVKPLFGPLSGLSGTQVAAPLLDQKPLQPPRDVPVDLAELVGGVAGAKVVAPAAQDRIQMPRSRRGYRCRPGCGRCGHGPCPSTAPWPFGWASGAGSSARCASVPTAAPTCAPGSDNPENPGPPDHHAGRPPSSYPDAAATPTTPGSRPPPPRRARLVPR